MPANNNTTTYRAWTEQAQRLGEPLEKILPKIIEAHAKRDIQMQRMEPLKEHDLSKMVSAMPPEELKARALRDFSERSAVPDSELKLPEKLTHIPGVMGFGPGFKPKAIHVFEVREQDPNERINLPLGLDGGVIAGYVSGHIWGVLASTKPGPLEGYPDLGQVQTMKFNEMLPKLSELERKRLAAETGADVSSSVRLDRRLAQMGVGYYLFQNRIRVFGDPANPTIRFVTDDELQKQKVTKKGDDLKDQIILAAGKIVTALQYSTTAMSMDWLIRRKELDPDIAHMALGMALGEGGRVSVKSQGKELFVKRIIQ